MKVALKYCGGCDPEFDRVAYFERIRNAAGDDIEWVRMDSRGHDALLLICGCDKVCPLEEIPSTGKMVLIKHDQAEPERVAARIRKRGAQ